MNNFTAWQKITQILKNDGPGSIKECGIGQSFFTRIENTTYWLQKLDCITDHSEPGPFFLATSEHGQFRCAKLTEQPGRDKDNYNLIGLSHPILSINDFLRQGQSPEVKLDVAIELSLLIEICAKAKIHVPSLDKILVINSSLVVTELVGKEANVSMHSRISNIEHVISDLLDGESKNKWQILCKDINVPFYIRHPFLMLLKKKLFGYVDYPINDSVTKVRLLMRDRSIFPINTPAFDFFYRYFTAHFDSLFNDNNTMILQVRRVSHCLAITQRHRPRIHTNFFINLNNAQNWRPDQMIEMVNTISAFPVENHLDEKYLYTILQLSILAVHAMTSRYSNLLQQCLSVATLDIQSQNIIDWFIKGFRNLEKCTMRVDTNEALTDVFKLLAFSADIHYVKTLSEKLDYTADGHIKVHLEYALTLRRSELEYAVDSPRMQLGL